MKLTHIEWHFPSSCGPIDINTIIAGKKKLRKALANSTVVLLGGADN